MSRQKKIYTALQRLTGVELNAVEERFVYEYTKDYDHRRAATVCGLHPDRGNQLIALDHIAEAVRIIYNMQLQSTELTAETVKQEMLNLYHLALQKGNYSIASRQLDQLAKHSHIDAYAAQKVAVAADAEVARALSDGRKRLNEARAAAAGHAPVAESDEDFM